MRPRRWETPKDAVPILEEFAPEPGYVLDHLLCLSYSLNPAVASALMVRCLPDIGKHVTEIDPAALKKDDIGRAVREIIPRSLFVIDGHNSIHNIDNMKEFEHLIMSRVEKTGSRLTKSTTPRGAFHPKLLLALYRPREHDDRPVYGKCYVGSRNFTLDLAEEFGTVLPLVVRSTHKEFTRGLGDFLEQAVVGELRRPNHVAKVREIARLLNTLKLGPPEIAPVHTIQFHWQDRRKPTTYLWPHLYRHFESADSIGIVSPWLSDQACQHLHRLKQCKQFKVRCLATETSALNCFKDDKPQRLQLAFGSEYSLYNQGDDQNRETDPPLHMKYYFTNSGSGLKQILFFGSANFTTSGMGLSSLPNTGPSSYLNTEILVQYDLRGDPSPYTLSGRPFEAEDERRPEVDPGELLHQEWLDALELTWVEFRRVLKVEYPPFALPLNRWHELTIEGFTTSPRRVENDIRPVRRSSEDEAPDEEGMTRDVIWKDRFILGHFQPTVNGFSGELRAHVPEYVGDADLSPLMYMSLRWKRNGKVCTTKVVPIPEDIQEAIRQARLLPPALRMTTADYLEALADITDGFVKTASGKRGKGSSKSRLETIISFMSLDRFAYRMAVLRHSEPHRFRSAFERTRDILSELDATVVNEEGQTTSLKEFKDVLRIVLSQLDESKA